jgi:hypothetical protein
LEAEGTSIDRDGKAQHIAVKRRCPFEIGDTQMHMADANG